MFPARGPYFTNLCNKVMYSTAYRTNVKQIDKRILNRNISVKMSRRQVGTISRGKWRQNQVKSNTQKANSFIRKWMHLQLLQHTGISPHFSVVCACIYSLTYRLTSVANDKIDGYTSWIYHLLVCRRIMNAEWPFKHRILSCPWRESSPSRAK